MLKIYTPQQASATILRRAPLNQQFPRFGGQPSPPEVVAQILASVRDEGDAALKRWTTLLDRVTLDDFRVPAERIQNAPREIAPELLQALELAAQRIRAFHQKQPLPGWQTRELGGVLGQRVSPIARVGVYVPGGRAPLPSSLLMSAIPAQVAGVPEIVVCTPPNPPPVILAAARICGLQDIFQLGGAQAIAALAFGTASIPKVDKIVGAGNLYVTLAKQQVFGLVGLDGLAGPTETMIIADHTANPRWIAADLMAQAEHDVLASAILLTPSRELAAAVQAEVARQIEQLPTADVVARALRDHGGIVLVPDLDTAAALANDYAAEHLCLSLQDPDALLPQLKNAGGIFIGERSFEVLGDYLAGPSHVMPTAGTARFASPLNVLDFVKITSIVRLDNETSRALSPPAARLARAESLDAHARAAELRLNRT